MKQDEAKMYKTAEFAKITGVTKRTLRHYDEIGLMKPSYRNDSDYRFYDQSDIRKMQQIITLKFIGLSIPEIREFINKDYTLKESLGIQLQIMERKASHMRRVIRAMQELEAGHGDSGDSWRKLFDSVKSVKMEQYYDNRAKEYDSIYLMDDQVRQDEQRLIKEQVKELFAGKNVLEIACGTGYWTEAIVETANKVTATDISDKMLEEIQNRLSSNKKVTFCKGDAYNLEAIKGHFNAGCANFWLSHVSKSRLDSFIRDFNKKLGSGALVFMADNIYIPGIGGEFISKPGDEDTYKIRQLLNGEKYEVVKNYYSEDQLCDIFAEHATEFHAVFGKYFWWLWYTVK